MPPLNLDEISMPTTLKIVIEKNTSMMSVGGAVNLQLLHIFLENQKVKTRCKYSFKTLHSKNEMIKINFTEWNSITYNIRYRFTSVCLMWLLVVRLKLSTHAVLCGFC